MKLRPFSCKLQLPDSGRTLWCFIVIGILASCTEVAEQSPALPYLGTPEVVTRLVNGEHVSDTVFPKIPSFSFIDQDSNKVTNSTFSKKIYVADFIFLSCPTICPKMTTELAKVQKRFAATPDVLFLSHTIDPENDSIPRLKMYASSLRVPSSKWHFVTGDQEKIMDIADKGYYAIAKKDAESPGGYAHSGGLLLIDRAGHIRGVYDGTNATETKRLIADIERLINE
jgi:protein SCO1